MLDLVRRLSIETPADGPGKLTLLYSGRVAPDGTAVPGMGDITTYIRDHYASSVRVIDNTGAANFDCPGQAGGIPHGLLDEPQGQLARQCADRELLQ